MKLYLYVDSSSDCCFVCFEYAVVLVCFAPELCESLASVFCYLLFYYSLWAPRGLAFPNISHFIHHPFYLLFYRFSWTLALTLPGYLLFFCLCGPHRAQPYVLYIPTFFSSLNPSTPYISVTQISLNCTPWQQKTELNLAKISTKFRKSK